MDIEQVKQEVKQYLSCGMCRALFNSLGFTQSFANGVTIEGSCFCGFDTRVRVEGEAMAKYGVLLSDIFGCYTVLQGGALTWPDELWRNVHSVFTYVISSAEAEPVCDCGAKFVQSTMHSDWCSVNG